MRYCLVIWCLLGIGVAYGQQTRTYFLKPIEIAPGPRYFYGGRHLGNNPVALQVPFFELGDPDVLRQYRIAKGLNLASGAVAFVPLAYLLFQNGRRYQLRSFWPVWWVSIGASIGFSIGRNQVIRRAVRRYNQTLASGSFGASLQPLPVGPAAPSFGVRVKF